MKNTTKKQNFEILNKLIKLFNEDSNKCFYLFEKHFGLHCVVKGYVVLDNFDKTKLHIRLEQETEGDDEYGCGVFIEKNRLVATLRHYDEDGYNFEKNIRLYKLEQQRELRW